MTKTNSLRHKDFAFLYGVGACTGLLIALAWYDASDRSSDFVAAVIVTLLCAAGPIQSIWIASAVTLNRYGRISRFKAIRTIVKL